MSTLADYISILRFLRSDSLYQNSSPLTKFLSGHHIEAARSAVAEADEVGE